MESQHLSLRVAAANRLREGRYVMRKLLITTIVVFSLFLVGCTPGIVEPIPTPVPNEESNGIINGITPVTPPVDAPPADRTWIGPGKVNIGNFIWICPNGHWLTSDIRRDWVECSACGRVYEVGLSKWEDKRFHPGARAEWPITIHNGNNFETSFLIKHRLPDYVGGEYARAPTDVMQDWVLIASDTPVLAPRETLEILIVLEMPAEVEESEAVFWQAKAKGVDRLKELWQGAYDEAYNQYMVDEKAKGVPHPEIVSVDDAEVAAREIANEWVLEDAEASLLVFLDDHGSVSTRLFLSRGSESFLEQFEELGYIARGDLRVGKWEFWLSVKDTTQTEMIQTELCSRWLVNMREQ